MSPSNCTPESATSPYDLLPKKADVSPQTILNVLNGTTWPDLRTIARLENALAAKLWGNGHRKARRR